MNESVSHFQDLSEIARARASMFAFLNIHFNNLPDQTFVKHIRSDNFALALKDLQGDETLGTDTATGAGLMQSYLHSTVGMNPTELSDALGVDRTRLYRGLSPSYGPPPPYEGVWSKTERNVTAVLQTVSGIYQADGMTVSPNAKDRLDYVGVELDYLYQLAMREAQAWDASEQEKASGLLARQDAFLSEHLGQWIPAFVEKALTQAETDFYRGHLMMLRGFLVQEQEQTRALLDEIKIAA
jgi:putative dimethyl sulfoxide reductase chaperone